ncbi:MAG: F0F1 ATP synthase subunit alpha, partial [Gemmatimonadales bacterium]
VEILKQPQYQPMPVELQVMVIYAVTNGFVDEVPVAEIRDWERGFLQCMSAQFPQDGEKIRSEKVRSKELEAELVRACERYNGTRKKTA